jgi:uncharacterized protein YukE
MAPVPKLIASARAHLEQAIQAEDASHEHVTALEAKRAELVADYERELTAWSGKGDAPAKALELQNAIDQADRELRTHRAKHAQLHAATDLARTAKLAAERSGAVNGVLNAYDDAASTAREITKSIQHLNNLFEQLKDQTKRIERRWPGHTGKAGAMVPITGLMHHPEEVVRFFGQELWRIVAKPFVSAGESSRKLQFPAPISGISELTGQRVVAGKSHQDMLPPLAERIASVKERARKVLVGEASLGGSHIQIWPTNEPEADEPTEDSTNAAE